MSIFKLILNLILSLGLASIIAIFLSFSIFIIEMFIAVAAQCNSATVFLGMGLEPPIYVETNTLCKILFKSGGINVPFLLVPLIWVGSFIAVMLNLRKKGLWLKWPIKI